MSASMTDPAAAPRAGANPAIRVSGLSKCYHIYDRPQDRLKQALFPKLHRLGHPLGAPSAPKYYREFWALRDVSFEVPRGEAMAIIGRNGAGKSTLLQLIAGTLAPSAGTVEVGGKVAALLELGSGFNPEFTGRENVYLNASLLGLSTAQTNQAFDEIAAFADIGDFIDQPVKTYSSGMMMRLAFAVQTAVAPEVLIVDEALSVGDVFFQAKCMARMRKLLADGVTLLWVSHDPGTVRQLCSRAVLLNHGEAVCVGDAADVADRYLHLELEERTASARRTPRSTDTARSEGEPAGLAAAAPSDVLAADGETTDPLSHSVGAMSASIAAETLAVGADAFNEKARFNRSGNRSAAFQNVQMLKDGKLSRVFDFGDVVTLRQVVRFDASLRNVNASYKIRTPQGVDVVFGDTRLVNAMGAGYDAGYVYVFDWTFRLDLLHGNYVVMSALAHPPVVPGEDWLFIDVVPICYDFRMLPRRDGMIDGLVTWHNDLSVRRADAAQLGNPPMQVIALAS